MRGGRKNQIANRSQGGGYANNNIIVPTKNSSQSRFCGRSSGRNIFCFTSVDHHPSSSPTTHQAKCADEWMEDDNTIIADSFIKLNIRQKGNKQTRSVYLSDLAYLVSAKLQVAQQVVCSSSQRMPIFVNNSVISDCNNKTCANRTANVGDGLRMTIVR